MVLNQVDPKPIPDSSNPTVSTATTPPKTAADLLDDHDPFGGAEPSSPSVPWPGSTFIIRSVSSEHVITLLNGRIVLARPGGCGSIHWACVETKGWLGFRNLASGRFLGHNTYGELCCSSEEHHGREKFCARMRPEGGYVLLMMYIDGLWQMGIKIEWGVEKLARIENGESDGIVWEFVKV